MSIALLSCRLWQYYDALQEMKIIERAKAITEYRRHGRSLNVAMPIKIPFWHSDNANSTLWKNLRIFLLNGGGDEGDFEVSYMFLMEFLMLLKLMRQPASDDFIIKVPFAWLNWDRLWPVVAYQESKHAINWLVLLAHDIH